MAAQFNYLSSSILLISLQISTAVSSTGRMLDDRSVFVNPDTSHILFIGASYFTYNNLPKMYEELVKSSGKTIAVTTFLINGTYMEQFAENPEVKDLIKQKPWDIVFLHESGPPVGYPETHYLFIPPYIQRHTYQALEQFKKMISENCSETKMIFLMPWAFEDGLTWISGQTDTFFDMQLKIYETTIKWSDEIGFITAPVGWAWRAVMLEQPPLHYLFQSDWNHPSVRGSYLTACVLYATAYCTSIIGNSYYAGLGKEEATYFQQIASSVVLEDIDLWNIPLENTLEDSFHENPEFMLLENFPNPFNPVTYLAYELPVSATVKLVVYDLLGRTVEILFDGKQSAGRWIFRWDAHDAPSGVYLSRIEMTDTHSKKRLFSRTKPIVLLK
jgi:hypothetical protein